MIERIDWIGRAAAVVLVLGSSLSRTWANEELVPKADDEAGFVSIFNGKDLSGWDGDPQAWLVKDSAICSSGANISKNWLVWRGGEPEDFELRLRFRFTKGNSGVQVRSKEIEKWTVQGYQVEVAAQAKMGLWHHSLSPSKQRSHLATAGQKVHIRPKGERKVEQFADPGQVQATYRDNQWNDMTVIAIGPRLIQKINGVVFAELIDDEEEFMARKGVVAFQDHGHGTVVEFQDIRLKVFRNTSVE